MNDPRKIGVILDEDDVVSWAFYNTVIKEYLKKRNTSVSNLAKLSGVSKSTIYRIMNLKKPGVITWKTYSRLFHELCPFIPDKLRTNLNKPGTYRTVRITTEIVSKKLL